MAKGSEETSETKDKLIQSDKDAKNGQKKCPKCGSTDISQNKKTGKLRCNFCRHEFDAEKLDGIENDLTKLEGDIIGSGAKAIVPDAKDILTLKCESCGAEVIIDTKESLQSRCHWCRNTLSINQQIPNGAVPDLILPFTLLKEEAEQNIQKFVKKRRFYANPKFKAEFTTENIMGVYFPYLVVDINAHSKLEGNGEVLIRQYTVGSDNNRRTLYDADVYSIKREFDITIDNLTVESNKDKLNYKDKAKTTNIINSIMPFDIENAVKWDANYLKGHTSEKRNVDVKEIKCLVKEQARDIARHKTNETLKKYNRGVAWKTDNIDIKGYQWLAAYLPVWLYSYQQVKGNKKLLHYVAVNARTKETMGSVPVHVPKLIVVSLLIEIVGLIGMLFVDFEYDFLFLTLGIIYYIFIYSRYRNDGARHTYEKETKAETRNMQEEDKLLRRITGASNSMIIGMNNLNVNQKSYEELKRIEEEQQKNRKD